MEKIQLLNQQKKCSTFYCFCHPQSVAGDCFLSKRGDVIFMLCINITFGAGNKSAAGKIFDFSYSIRNTATIAEKLIKRAKKIRIKLLKTPPKPSESVPKKTKL